MALDESSSESVSSPTHSVTIYIVVVWIYRQIQSYSSPHLRYPDPSGEVHEALSNMKVQSNRNTNLVRLIDSLIF